MLNRMNLGLSNVAHRQLAGSLGCAIDVHGAGSAKTLAASIFRTQKAELVAKHPKQWHVLGNIYFPCYIIDIELIRHASFGVWAAAG